MMSRSGGTSPACLSKSPRKEFDTISAAAPAVSARFHSFEMVRALRGIAAGTTMIPASTQPISAVMKSGSFGKTSITRSPGAKRRCNHAAVARAR